MSARDTIGKWPIAGYAPGNYHCKCANCETTFEGDKRAIQCLPCALTSSGYRILGPGDIDPATVEKCAEMAEEQAEWVPLKTGDMRTAIRALCATHQGDK